MGSNTMRLVTIVFLINFLVVMIAGFIANSSQENIGDLNDQLESWSGEFNTNFPNPNPDTETSYLDKQFGDIKAGGKTLSKVFLGIVIPPLGGCGFDGCNEDLFYWLHILISTIMAILHVSLVIKAWQFFVNKSSD